MSHFGNSLSYKEIIEDIKICADMDNEENNYEGKQFDTQDVGHYDNGNFIKKGTRTTEYIYTIRFIKSRNKWLLSSINDSGYFNSLAAAKNRARIVFGNGIKWTKL